MRNASEMNHKQVGFYYLQHDNSHSAHLLLIGQVLVIDTTRNRSRAVVVQVEVELAVTSTELQLLQEQRVVVQGQSVENIEFGL